MKAYLVVSGAIFALFSAMHVFLGYEHWRSPAAEAWSVLAPILIAVLSGALATWAFRLTRSSTAMGA